LAELLEAVRLTLWADSSSPFFLLDRFSNQPDLLDRTRLLMNWQSAVERTVMSLGYDLVDAEKSVGGLLRVFIDHLPGSAESAAGQFITVDDCEKVTRQLQYVLEVEACAYERLEVSSPGLDRPLKRAADYARFVGELVELTLKEPLKGRKKFSGELQALAEGWRLVLVGRVKKPGKKAIESEGSAKPEGESDLALDFSIEEVREARLVPVVDFKGRRFSEQDEQPSKTIDEVDGGRIQ
jgi:ribosome maturation factor RimP